MSASAHRYSCAELGACQSRNTPCAGCTAAHQASDAEPIAPLNHDDLDDYQSLVDTAMRATFWRGFIAGFIGGVLLLAVLLLPVLALKG